MKDDSPFKPLRERLIAHAEMGRREFEEGYRPTNDEITEELALLDIIGDVQDAELKSSLMWQWMGDEVTNQVFTKVAKDTAEELGIAAALDAEPEIRAAFHRGLVGSLYRCCVPTKTARPSPAKPKSIRQMVRALARRAGFS